MERVDVGDVVFALSRWHDVCIRFATGSARIGAVP